MMNTHYIFELNIPELHNLFIDNSNKLQCQHFKHYITRLIKNLNSRTLYLVTASTWDSIWHCLSRLYNASFIWSISFYLWRWTFLLFIIQFNLDKFIASLSEGIPIEINIMIWTHVMLILPCMYYTKGVK